MLLLVVIVDYDLFFTFEYAVFDFSFNFLLPLLMNKALKYTFHYIEFMSLPIDDCIFHYPLSMSLVYKKFKPLSEASFLLYVVEASESVCEDAACLIGEFAMLMLVFGGCNR